MITKASNQLPRHSSAKEVLRKRAKYLLSATSERKFSTLELERVGRDVSTLVDRLRTREYLRTSFQHRNLLNIIDRTEEIFSDLAFFASVGHVWRDIVRHLGISMRGDVLDIGSGFFPKMELGLYYSGFCGRVTLLDTSSRALAGASRFLDFFRMPFRHRAAKQTIWEPIRIKFDLVAANHALDDLLLSHYCKRNRLSLTHIYTEERLFMDAWENILDDQILAQEIMEKLALRVASLTKPGGFVVFVDYPSFSHRSLKLRRLINYTNKLRDILRVTLSKNNFISIRPFDSLKVKYDRLLVKADHCVAMRAPKLL